MLNRIIKNENSTFMPLLKRKKKIFQSKMDHALRTDHMHYFNKKEVLEFRKKESHESIIDPRCVVCGLRLTQYRAQIRYETMEIPALKDGR